MRHQRLANLHPNGQHRVHRRHRILEDHPDDVDLMVHELRELQERLHILAGFLKLFGNLDRAIKIIRQSASRADAAKLLMKEFKLDDIYQAGQVSQQLEKAAGPGFMATNWMEQNKAIFRALRLERLVTFITIGLIVFVAALNILIALTMMVMEKTRDIAVLMSMGTRKSQVRRVFIAQGVLIGLIGTAIGLILGYFLSWAGGHYHVLSLSPEVYSIDYVPFVPRALDGVLVAAIAVGISFIATVYPSWAAARILPAEALRYE